MKDKFSTFDIEKALSIPYQRLREWVSRGYFKIQPAEGRGTKAVFNRTDVLAVKFFQKLVEKGYKREYAARFVDLFYQGFFREAKAIAFLQGTKENGKAVQQAISFLPEHKAFEIDLDTGKTPKIDNDPGKIKNTWDLIECEWDEVVLINLRKLKREVDKALARLEIS